MSYPSGPISVAAVGTKVTSGTSAATAIPNDASGNTARVVRIASDSDVYVMPGFSGGTATNGGIPVTNGAPLLLNVQGFTHILSLQWATGAVFNITPVEV